MSGIQELILALGVIALSIAAMIYLLRPGGYPPVSRTPHKEDRMSRIKEVGGWIAVCVFVAALSSALLELSNWHLGETGGAILVAAATVTFVLGWLSGNIPSGLRPALAVVAAICWLALVIHTHAGSTTGWRVAAYAAAILGPMLVALAADFVYEDHRTEQTLRSIPG